MFINWDTQVPGPGGLLIPTYGNYGGPGYSDGEVLDYPTQPVDYDRNPVDALDALFLIHDQAYDSQDPATRAAGDVELAKGIAAIPDQQFDSEASLYGGFATLFAIYLLVEVNKQPDLLEAGEYLFLTQSAVGDIERGLAVSDPTELAAIADWLGHSVDVVATPSVEALVGVDRPFDFSQVVEDGLSGTDLADFADEASTALPSQNTDQAATDIVETLLTTGGNAVPSELQNWLHEQISQTPAQLDWLV